MAKHIETDNLPRLYNLLGWATQMALAPQDNIKSNQYLEYAELFDYNATSTLGDRYKSGTYVEQDFTKALYYYEKTLEINEEDPWTLVNLGQMCHHGWGIKG